MSCHCKLQITDTYIYVGVCFFPVLKLNRLVKIQGIRLKDLDWFVSMVNIGAYKIPQIQKQYSKAKDELEVIEYDVKT